MSLLCAERLPTAIKFALHTILNIWSHAKSFPMSERMSPRGGRSRPQLALFAIVALSVPGCANPAASLYPPRPGEPSRTVYVVNHSLLHTGVAVRRSDIPRGVWPASRDYADFKYVEVGWGEDDGYRKPLTVRTAFHALRGSHRTVLLAGGFDSFDQPRPAVVAIDLSLAGFDRLCRHIAQSYALDSSGQPIRLAPDWYRARGRYSAFHNCNNWVANGLRAAGCPINSTISISPRPLLLQVRQIGRDIRKAQTPGR